MKIVEEIKQDLSALELLHDWLGEQGEPVHCMVAEFRAQHCIVGNDGKPCPCNVAPNWWDKVKDKVAEVIRVQLSLRGGMKLFLKSDDKLHMCSACGCCLKLKVHVPMAHIKAHTTQQALDKMPPYCWIKKEMHSYA